MSLIDTALRTARQGLYVFPLEPLGIEPLHKPGVAEATTDEAIIREWWTVSPSANIGLATGRASGLIAVGLSGAAAIAWWRSCGFGSGIVVLPPTSDTEIHVFKSEASITTFSPRHGVTVKGEGGWIVAPGSILRTGSVRGDLSSIPPAPFSGERDFKDDESRGGRLLGLLDVGNRIPALTSTGGSLIELTMRLPREGALGHAGALRRRLMKEALVAGMSRRDAASLAFGSAAGRDVREAGDSERVWTELEEVERSLGDQGPTPMTLLESGERESAESEWWGTQFVEVLSGSTKRRADLWRLLSESLGADLLVPTSTDSVWATFDVLLTSDGDAVSGDRGLLGNLEAALGIIGRPAAAEGVNGWTAAQAAARAWVTPEPALVDSSEASPWLLATELGDARDRLLTTAGLPPYSVRMSDEATARHARFRSGLSEFLDDPAATEFDLVVRKAAALVAASEGSNEVNVRHELIALKECEDWIANLVWVIDQLDLH